MRNMRNENPRGEESQLDTEQDLALAYEVVPRVEVIPAGAGEAGRG